MNELDIDMRVRTHRVSDPTVVRRRGELRRIARMLRERSGGFVRGRRSRARRAVVHQLATILETSHRHARWLFEGLRDRGLVRFDPRCRGFRVRGA